MAVSAPRTGPVWTARRILRLWGLHARMDLLWLARDVKSVAIFLLSDVLSSIATVTGTLLLAARFNGIGRWSLFQVVFMLGYALLAGGLTSVLFNYNVAFISRRIGRGQLDHTLIQPQPMWMSLLTEGFAPFSTVTYLLPGLILFIWAMGRGDAPVSPAWVVLLLLNLAASAAIAVAFSFLWGSVAFWAPRAAEEINSSSWKLLDGLMFFPLNGVGPLLLTSLLTVIPAGFLGWYPCRALLGLDRAASGPYVTPLAALVFITVTALVFRGGLRHYERTGSQRYLAWGHRR